MAEIEQSSGIDPGPPELHDPGEFRHQAPRPEGELDIRLFSDLEAVAGYWLALEAHGTCSIYQTLEWARIALDTLERSRRPELVIAVILVNGEPAFLLPLVRSRRWLPVLRWIGGSHVNFNMALQSPDFSRLAGENEMRALVECLREAVGAAGLLLLCCQPRAWNGHRNPFVSLPNQVSINPAYTMDLREGFDALVVRGNAKRKRKKFRAQGKVADAMGGWRLVVGEDRETAEILLESFFEQKAQRLRNLGIRDAFSEPGARDMLRRLAEKSLGRTEPMLRLYGLEVGGKLRAIFGGGVKDRHLSGYFSSIAEDEFAAQSPGEMLLHLVTQHACSQGMTSMDLGNGDERYKRSWCDGSMELLDTILPLGPVAWPRAWAIRKVMAMRKFIRNDERAWEIVKTARRLRAGFGMRS